MLSDSILPLFKFAAWMFFVPLGIAAIGSIFLLFTQTAKSNIHPALSVISLSAMAAPGLALGYALLWDWSNGLPWVGAAFIWFFVGGAIFAVCEMRKAGLTFGDVLLEARRMFWAVWNSNKVIRPPGQPTAANDSVAPSSPLGACLPGYLWELKKPVAGQILVCAIALEVRELFATDEPVVAVVIPLLLLATSYCAENFTARYLRVERLSTPPTSLSVIGIGIFYGSILVLGSYFFATILAAPDFGSWLGSSSAVAITGLCVTLNACSRSLLRLASMKRATNRSVNDHRPPVLYLRPFAREGLFAGLLRAANLKWRYLLSLWTFARALIRFVRKGIRGDEDGATSELLAALTNVTHGRTLYGPISIQSVADNLAGGKFRLYDEQLVMAEIFNEIGPYLAIARPGESAAWSDVGSAKIKVADDHWQARVLEVLETASIVIIEAGVSEWLIWELEQVVAKAAPRKVLLILPNYEEDYGRFCRLTRSVLPVPLPTQKPETRFMMFDDWWNPFPLLNRTDVLGPDIWTSCVTVLAPFIERNGYVVGSSGLERPSDT